VGGVFLGRSLNKRQRSALGFVNGKTPFHATLTETFRAAQHLFSPRVRPQGPEIRLAFADESNRAVSTETRLFAYFQDEPFVFH
jgi:hypothetical protein